MASAIAYFSLFSLFPLILLSISIASFGLGPAFAMDEHIIVQRLEFIAPALGQLLGNNIDQIIRARGSVSSVALLRADWTRRDPEITSALAQLGRNGVPVYVFYKKGRAPVVLSELPSASEISSVLAKP